MKCIWIISLLVLNVALIDACGPAGAQLMQGRMMDPVPSGEQVNDQQLEPLAVSEFLAQFCTVLWHSLCTILRGKTPMELFQENDADNNGCVDFDEALDWITSRRNSVNPLEMVAEAGFAAVHNLPMDDLFAKTMEKLGKQKIYDGQPANFPVIMKAIWVKIVGKEDGCYTFDQSKQWAISNAL